MMKAKEQFDEVKRKFDLINTELHDELPALYNSRVLFLITNLQPYFAAEQLFHSESSKVRKRENKINFYYTPVFFP
jgi:amphiphysin